MKHINTILSDTFEDESRDIVILKSQKYPVTETAYIQVEDASVSTEVTVAGRISQLSDFSQLALIDMKNFNMVNSITAEGIYLLLSEELQALRVTADGKATITVKVVE